MDRPGTLRTLWVGISIFSVSACFQRVLYDAFTRPSLPTPRNLGWSLPSAPTMYPRPNPFMTPIEWRLLPTFEYVRPDRLSVVKPVFAASINRAVIGGQFSEDNQAIGLEAPDFYPHIFCSVRTGLIESAIDSSQFRSVFKLGFSDYPIVYRAGWSEACTRWVQKSHPTAFRSINALRSRIFSVSPNGCIAVVRVGGVAALYNLATNHRIGMLCPDDGHWFNLSFSKDSSLVLSRDPTCRSIRLWNVGTCQELTGRCNSTVGATDARFLENGGLVVARERGCLDYYIDPVSPTPIHLVNGNAPTYLVQVNDRYVLGYETDSKGHQTRSRLWDVTRVGEVPLPDNGNVRAIQYLGAGKYLLASPLTYDRSQLQDYTVFNAVNLHVTNLPLVSHMTTDAFGVIPSTDGHLLAIAQVRYTGANAYPGNQSNCLTSPITGSSVVSVWRVP